jgi:ATP/maltotriose-dependent transcriptional regulator MalT
VRSRDSSSALGWHHTPEHGSWLSIAEDEPSVLAGQCLNQRIPAKASSIREVSTWVAEGLSNREMADRLIVSLRTVKGHVQNIQGKLGVHSRTQAVARADAVNLL